MSKPARDRLAAMRAMARFIQFIAANVVPVAHDQRGLARRAESGTALRVVHIAGVNVVQAGFECDLAGALQGRWWGRWQLV